MFSYWVNSAVLVVVAVIVGMVSPQPNCGQPPPRKNLIQCCTPNDMINQVETKCFEKFPPKDPSRQAFDFCFGECMFNETGMTENGEFHLDKAKTKMAEFLKDVPEFRAVAEQALIKCDKMVKDRIASRPGGPPPLPFKPPCNPHITMIGGCVVTECFVNCPASRWQNNEACNNAKEYMKACAIPPHPQ